ncbi:protein FAR-RED ELONGATED HYPOCOTYL 3-like [Lycium ferocissimum]|uniref:protein FAR-RED ELONGATED HYPOCOTYL 3-like n=1 Tax=Lycium ferocissimum TaxID=112874 RepID=UPI0028162BFE|nr:protein FAR-RED ELONGATED HYPOCOTYL 3-like [Lycium ferocissimum]
MIPAHYILKIWTKDATNIHEMDANLVGTNSNPKVKIIVRYRYLCQTFVQISSEASESKEGYELAAKCTNKIIAKLNDVKKRNESHEELIPSNNIQNEPSETVFVDNTNVTKVTGLKRKEPTCRSNTRPKSFMEKAQRKNKTSLPKFPLSQTDQQFDNFSSLQVPYPPVPDASMTMGAVERSFRPWCPSQLSQGSSHGSLTQLLRDVSFHDLNKYSRH